MPFSSVSLKEGEKAPALSLTSPSKDFSLDNGSGHYVLVNFWSAQDAASRILNKRYADVISSNPDSSLDFVSVCIDDDSALAEEIMRIDGCSPKLSFNLSHIKGSVLEDYQTDSGCRSFLIDSYGNMMKVNPTPETVTQLSRG